MTLRLREKQASYPKSQRKESTLKQWVPAPTLASLVVPYLLLHDRAAKQGKHLRSEELFEESLQSCYSPSPSLSGAQRIWPYWPCLEIITSEHEASPRLNVSVYLIDLHDDLIRLVLISSPFYWWGNWGTEQFDWLKSHRSHINSNRIWTQSDRRACALNHHSTALPPGCTCSNLTSGIRLIVSLSSGSCAALGNRISHHSFAFWADTEISTLTLLGSCSFYQESSVKTLLSTKPLCRWVN